MAHSHSVKEYPKQVVAIMAISAGVGAGLAMLLTLRRGQETRGVIGRRLRELKDRSVQSDDSAREKIRQSTRTMADTMDSAKARAKTSTTKIKQDAKQAARDVKADTKQSAKEAKDVADHIRRNGEP